MKSFAALSLLLAAVANAQEIQSKPFNLVLSSADKDLNGQKLSACHSGAAIESLCLAGDSGSKFFLNTTKGAQSPIDGLEPSGTLVWKLPVGNLPEPVPEPMSFYVDPSTNVAMPMFQPGYDQQQVMFDDKSQMGIYGYLDDTVSPPTFQNATVLRNWYVCQTYYTGYTYETLAWALGNESAKPQNPSCVKVQVQRKDL